ncbi:MAG: tripartite tricarboxylate transporter TctB family protein [Hyphomicrobiales bacterium]
MRKAYLITYTVWIVLSCAAAVESWRLGFGSFVRPGPGFVPFLAAALLGVLAVVGLIQSAPAKSADGKAEGFDGRDLLRILLLIAALAVYVLLWDLLGFPAATFLVLLLLYRAVEPLRWRTVLISSLLTLAGTYVLFSTLLGARLPAGRLWTYLMN